jgi:hypothetical protein
LIGPKLSVSVRVLLGMEFLNRHSRESGNPPFLWRGL